VKARRAVERKHVRRELIAGQSPALLKELHLLTRDGNLNADALRKLKQVNHLVGLLQPALDDLWERHPQPSVVDAASGNAYLAFILYELFFKPSDKGELTCIESRPELTARSQERAKSLGYDRMKFVTAKLDDPAGWPSRVHLVTALHACDTATDDALAAAIRAGADHVAVVPCCQAEVAQQLKERKGGELAQALAAHPWHRREFGSHLTNVIRALALEASGYQVTVTELTGFEHSLKNELILGRRVHRESRPAKERLDRLLADTGVQPKLVRLLAPAS
jgi:hypothetical protein